MRTIHIHGSAESDLIDVWRYSFEQWGELQADKYLDELDSGIRKLADNSEIGMKRDYVRDGYRVLFVRSQESARPASNCRAPTAVMYRGERGRGVAVPLVHYVSRN